MLCGFAAVCLACVLLGLHGLKNKDMLLVAVGLLFPNVVMMGILGSWILPVEYMTLPQGVLAWVLTRRTDLHYPGTFRGNDA